MYILYDIICILYYTGVSIGTVNSSHIYYTIAVIRCIKYFNVLQNNNIIT